MMEAASPDVKAPWATSSPSEAEGALATPCLALRSKAFCTAETKASLVRAGLPEESRTVAPSA